MNLQYKAIIFDFDGTLTKRCSIDFSDIRTKTGCPEGIYLLDYFQSLSPVKRKEATAYLEDQEFKAAVNSEEEPYASALISYLKKMNIPVSLVSRNSRRSVYRALENFSEVGPEDFYTIITRDDPIPVKPDPASINHIALELGVQTSCILMVGDYIHDIEAGQNAGCHTVYKLTGRDNDHLVEADFRINCLSELIQILNS